MAHVASTDTMTTPRSTTSSAGHVPPYGCIYTGPRVHDTKSSTSTTMNSSGAGRSTHAACTDAPPRTSHEPREHCRRACPGQPQAHTLVDLPDVVFEHMVHRQWLALPDLVRLSFVCRRLRDVTRRLYAPRTLGLAELDACSHVLLRSGARRYKYDHHDTQWLRMVPPPCPRSVTGDDCLSHDETSDRMYESLDIANHEPSVRAWPHVMCYRIHCLHNADVLCCNASGVRPNAQTTLWSSG